MSASDSPQRDGSTRQARRWRTWLIGHVHGLLLRCLPSDAPQGDTLRRALVTAAAACLFALIAPLYAFLIWFLERPPAVYYFLSLATAIAAGASLWLSKRGRYGAASGALLLVGNAIVVTTLVREGPSSQAAGNLAITVVMAALLVGWRTALVTGLGGLALVAALGALSRAGLYEAAPVAYAQGVFGLMQIGIITVLLLVFDGVRLGLVEAQRGLEQRLAQAHRLEALGRVAGGIAHDFNNLLTVILTNASLVGDTPSNETIAREIRGAALRGSQLTKQLLAFSRQQKLEPRSFDLAALVNEERTMLARLIPETIRIVVERPATPVWAHADPGQISQVVLNLVVNARDAMPQGGTLTIGVSTAAGDRVHLVVRDTGTGMDPQTLERAFEPFFTTKGAVGTGLGLATVHGIVTQSGGTIHVRSGAAGTAFELSLPAGLVPGDQPLRESSGEIPRARRRMILLVEDDDGVRGAVTRLLKSLGHDVTACAEIESALAAWRTNPAAIDLILSDVVMPGGGGPELLRALPEGHGARILFMSGYTNDALKAPDLASVPFLAKPFTQRELAKKLAEVLGVSEVDLALTTARVTRLDA